MAFVKEFIPEEDRQKLLLENKKYELGTWRSDVRNGMDLRTNLWVVDRELNSFLILQSSGRQEKLPFFIDCVFQYGDEVLFFRLDEETITESGRTVGKIFSPSATNTGYFVNTERYSRKRFEDMDKKIVDAIKDAITCMFLECFPIPGSRVKTGWTISFIF